VIGSPQHHPRMQRDILRKILERAAGVSRDGDAFQCEEGKELTLYLGEPGRAMVVSNVQRIALLDSHIEIKARDRGTLFTVTDFVQAVQAADTETKGQKRSGVGFSR
jgi:hypothetical protein